MRIAFQKRRGVFGCAFLALGLCLTSLITIWDHASAINLKRSSNLQQHSAQEEIYASEGLPPAVRGDVRLVGHSAFSGSRPEKPVFLQLAAYQAPREHMIAPTASDSHAQTSPTNQRNVIYAYPYATAGSPEQLPNQIMHPIPAPNIPQSVAPFATASRPATLQQGPPFQGVVPPAPGTVSHPSLLLHRDSAVGNLSPSLKGVVMGASAFQGASVGSRAAAGSILSSDPAGAAVGAVVGALSGLALTHLQLRRGQPKGEGIPGYAETQEYARASVIRTSSLFWTVFYVFLVLGSCVLFIVISFAVCSGKQDESLEDLPNCSSNPSTRKLGVPQCNEP